MAIYWTAIFSSQYGENSDGILITMKRFNLESTDKYPTFSLCIKGTELHWHHEHEIFEAYGLNASQYESMLKGEAPLTYELDDLSKVYRKIPVFVNDGFNVNFDLFHLQLPEILSGIQFKKEKTPNIDDDLYEDSMNTSIASNIPLSYESPDTLCFTRKPDERLNSIKLQDMITFNSSKLRSDRYKDAEIQIFIHHPGQLMSSFDQPKYASSFSYLLSTLKEDGTTPKILDFKISQCRVLRKRHDSNIPCNKQISNYDQFIQMELIKHLECIPPYWKNINSTANRVEECTSVEKLQEAYRYITDLKRILHENEQPCDEMLLQSIDSINYKPNPVPRDMSIAFHYTEKMYEEIQYTRAMGFESWLSNVGGFVGIFLGYSIMQIPDIISYVFKLLSSRKNRCSFV